MLDFYGSRKLEYSFVKGKLSEKIGHKAKDSSPAKKLLGGKSAAKVD